MELTEVRYEVADGVATLTLDRPGRRNAFTGTMADELARGAAAADADDAVRGVLVRGCGRGRRRRRRGAGGPVDRRRPGLLRRGRPLRWPGHLLRQAALRPPRRPDGR